jgi:hypothetical protein
MAEKIQIKNIKHSEFSSHETHCFEATVYINGKRSFIASNQGQGGCNNYHGLKANDSVYDQVKKINAELGKEKIDCYGSTISNDLDIVIGDLLNDYLVEKDAKKLVKKVCYIGNDGNIYSMPTKIKPTEAVLAAIKKQKWWKKSYVLLNEMPIEKVVEYLKKQ